MSEVSIDIEVEIEKLSGKGSRAFNKTLKDIVAPLVLDIITEEVKINAKKNASGISLPPQRLPEQATHPVGKSDSGYTPTGFLEMSIESREMAGLHSRVVSTVSYADCVEFGTGIYGLSGQPIVPTTKEALKFTTPNFGTQVVASVKGQRPNPFMRGSVWLIVDNPSPLVEKIQSELDKL